MSILALFLANEVRGSITDGAILSAVEQGAGTEFSVVWSDPTYLLQDFSFTPVVEAGLARFQAPAGVDAAAMLVLRTEASAENPSGNYPHDYRVCQSIHAASLVGLSPFRAGGGEFLMMEMAQPSVHEFAATLQVREEGSNYVVDSQIFSVLYESGLPGDRFTFQVWSKSRATTVALVERLLAGLANHRPLVTRNTLPRAIPAAVVRRLQMIGDRVMLELEAPQTVEGLDVTLVSWQYPNPTPNVTHSIQTVAAGRSIRLLPLTAATTDVQVYLDFEGVLQDKVLTSFNAWGPLASGWFPFSDTSGSSAGILRSPLSGLHPGEGEVVMNGSAVRLSGNLITGGFIGMYIDVFPALQGSGDLRGYDRWFLRSKQTSSISSLPVEMKLELDDGTTRSTTIAIGSSWNAQEIPVSRFGDWETIGGHVERVVLAVTGSPGAVSLDIDHLTLKRKDLPCTACGSLPLAVTLGAGPFGYTSAGLNGIVNPNGSPATGWFEWGQSTSYGSETPHQAVGNGTQAVGLFYPLSNIACGVQYHFRAAAANESGTSFGSDQVLALPECPPANGGNRYFTVTPCRALDTRTAQAYQSGTDYAVTLGGPLCAIPYSAKAVSANVTVVGSTGSGYLTAWSANGQKPGTSIINFAAGQTRANNAVLILDAATGRILVQPFVAGAGSVHVIVDVNGYFD